MNRKQRVIRGSSWMTEEQILELDRMWASASQPVSGLIHGRTISRCREDFLDKMLELWPLVRENLNLRR